jgi:hypothetical protein
MKPFRDLEVLLLNCRDPTMNRLYSFFKNKWYRRFKDKSGPLRGFLPYEEMEERAGKMAFLKR